MPRLLISGKYFYSGDNKVRLYGANLTENALDGSHAQSDIRVQMFKDYGFNAVRLHEIPDYTDDNFLYLISEFKRAGIYWEIPLNVSTTDFTDEATIVANIAYMTGLLSQVNSYTGQTIGSDNALVMVELANEASCLRDNRPLEATWNGYTQQEKEDYVTWAETTENAYYDRVTTAIRAHTNAYLIGSQSSYMFQTNALDVVDEHFYSNRVDDFATGPPYHMSNKKILDDAAFWPYTNSAERLNDKPFGTTEYNDWYPCQFYYTNYLTMLAIAAWQDWAYFFTFDLGRENALSDRCWGITDDANPGKKDMLLYGERIFRNSEMTASSSPESNVYPATYIEDIVSLGWTNMTTRAFNIDQPADAFAVGGGSSELVCEFETTLEITLPNITFTAGNTAVIVEDGVTTTISKCENTGVTWTPDTPTAGTDEFDTWGVAPVIYTKVVT